MRHVLVDEFQDTNFNQLDILEPFVAEFLSGGSGEAAVPPTVFFVGDLKQSIYGFRGAEPGIFAAMIARLEHYGQGSHTLPTNFRSLPQVVDGVETLFRREPLVSRLPDGEAAQEPQQAARDDAQGEITLIAPYEDDEDAGHSGQQRAAVAAARIVRELVDGGTTTLGDGGQPRPLVWSDVMVLYRSRTGVSLYEEAFRRAGIPIEPAGRGMLAASREVQDVLALLRWLVWPEDEIALAVVLRSPIARLGEARVPGVCWPPATCSARAPPAAGAPRPTCGPPCASGPTPTRELAPIAARLQAWRADTGFVSCHELLRRIYREGDLPERYAAARGPQARINLERLYDLALSPEIAGAPTVRRFIELVDKAGRRGGHEEGTPGSGGDGGRVRFMTVHGAKGLEAPVVLLVDADRALNDKTSEVRLDPRSRSPGLVFGATRSYRLGIEGAEAALEPDLLQQAGEAAADAAGIEETNLLYVAMTRARDRLYVLGGKGREKEDGEARSALRRLRAAAEDEPPVRLDDPDFLERPPQPAEVGEVPTAADEPAVMAWTPPVLGGRPAVVAPSAAAQDEDPVIGGAPVHARAADHGLKVHLWLQLAAERGSLPPGTGAARDEAAAVAADPRLAWILRPEASAARGLSEVAVILARQGKDGREERVTGVIDRLVVASDRIDVIDYKTNRWGGDPARRAWLVDHYRPQLAAYAEAAAVLFPGRAVRSWLLLTDPAGRGPDESGLVEVTP